MSLSDKSILVITDDEVVLQTVKDALEPLVKTLITASSGAEGIKKLANQNFDCFVLRTKKPTLADPKQIFQWTQLHKNHKTVPWIVLGKDIENEQIVIT